MNPNKLALEFLNQYFYSKEDDAFTLHFWRGSFYKYGDGYYIKISDSDITSLVTGFLQEDYMDALSITQHLISNVIINIKGARGIFISEDILANTWVRGLGREVRTMAFNNGLLATYLDSGKSTLVFHSPVYFTLTKLPYDYDPMATCPKWETFLNDVMDGDMDRVKLLQQWAGYLFTQDLREQRFLLCSGEGQNGKGVFFETIEKMVGRVNCSHVTLANFGDKFALSATLGKVLNSSTESSKEIGAHAETTLKAFTAGDRLEFSRKFKSPINAVPTAKVMIATNELPRFADKTNGVWRRLLYVPFEKEYYGEKENKHLAEELEVELSGIFNWAMKGDTTDGFIKPDKCKSAFKDYRRNTNPARAHLEDNYLYNSDGESTRCCVAYAKYKDYCIENGYSPMNESNFGREVKREFPFVVKKRQGSKGKREYAYVGLTAGEDGYVPYQS